MFYINKNMNIQCIKQHQKYNSQIYFKSNNRTVTSNGKFLYKNASGFFRQDLNWNNLVEHLSEKYKQYNKVTIYCYACSEGAEPFSMAMLLIEKLGKEKAQKFFPIIASDIDSKILENPKKGILKLSAADIKNMDKFLGNNHKKYVEYTERDYMFKHDSELEDEVCEGRIKPILENKVIFKNADILKDIDNINTNNNIIMCRNMWGYIGEKAEWDMLAKKIANKTDNNSLCIVGSQEILPIPSLLFDNGLEPGGVYHCYEKNTTLKQPDYKYLMH